MKRCSLTLLGLLLAMISGLHAQPTATHALFSEEEVLEVTLSTNMKALLKDKGENPSYHPANLAYTDADGQQHDIPLRVKVRGNFRRKYCRFPPIRLNFDSATVSNTVFEGENKLKLVTHCNSKKEEFDQYVMHEFLTYKLYNLMTDKSFRVRLLQVTYTDSLGNYEPITRLGFLIEDQDRMAQRLGGKVMKISNVHPDHTSREVVDLLSVFQYMVGNTDWSIPGLHNVRLVMDSIPGKPPVAIPYDFDWCGVVDAPYAKPNPMLEISSVKHRLYRGFCRTPEEFKAVFSKFLEKQDEIMALYKECSQLSDARKEEAVSYMDEFFATIQNDKEIKREFLDKCR